MQRDFVFSISVWETLFDDFYQVVCVSSQDGQLVSGELMLFYISHKITSNGEIVSKGSLQKKNSQIWDIVQKIETPPPTPPNLDVLSLDILR